MTAYVAGFLFDDSRSRVALIRKARPDWQAGKLNGIGGHVEPGETIYEAMMREFEEEAGVRLGGWEHFATVAWDGGDVAFFRAFSGDALSRVRTVTDERIEVYRVRELASIFDALPNLSWLIPLARYTHDRYAPVVAREVAP